MSKKDKDILKRLTSSTVENMCQSMFDDFIKANAETSVDIGLSAKVIREEVANCCSWCRGLAGTYEYGKEPDNVYQRHDNCKCLVVFKREKEPFQDAWSKKKYNQYEDAREARIKEIRTVTKASHQRQLENKILREEWFRTYKEHGLRFKEWKELRNKYGNFKKDDIIIKDKVREKLKKSGIENNPVKKLSQKLSDSEIIERIAGGDMTDGSCSSLGFAYIGNKNGLDVLDFRGGKSCDYFSNTNNIVEIARLPGVSKVIIDEYNDITAATELLKTMNIEKQYYLATGQHAAIVRRTTKGYEYLELQSETNNGFFPLTRKELKDRFGCQKSHSRHRKKYKVSNVLIDIDSLNNNEEFKEILGYINTGIDKQYKGVAGGIK